MKKYSKPTITEVKIDCTASLILMSTLGNGNGQGGGWGAGGKPKGSAQVNNTPLNENPFDTNAFQ